jgi:hypothetical protein
MTVPRTAEIATSPSADRLYRKMRSENTQGTVSFSELVERREIVRLLYGMVNWGRAKLAPWDVTAEVKEIGDTYEAVVRVTWKPLPPMPKVIYDRGSEQ